MYIIAKCAQAAGLVVLLIAFLKNFPDLMSYNILYVGLALFVSGWLIQKFMLKS